MKFAWIQTQKAHYPIHKLCRWLAVTPSGYYAWCQRPESAHATRDRTLAVLVQASFGVHHESFENALAGLVVGDEFRQVVTFRCRVFRM